MPIMHIPCPGCGAMVVAQNPRCRYCGRPMAHSEVQETTPPPAPMVSLGMDSFALMVAVVAFAFPIHAILAGITPPYAVPEAALEMDIRYAVMAATGMVVGGLWRPRTLRGLLLLLLFTFHGLAFVQMTSWRSGIYGLDPNLGGLGFTVGAVAMAGAILGIALRVLVQEAEGEAEVLDAGLG